jgi:hypothetical protein
LNGPRQKSRQIFGPFKLEIHVRSVASSSAFIRSDWLCTRPHFVHDECLFFNLENLDTNERDFDTSDLPNEYQIQA